MPIPQLKSLAKKAGVSLKKIEKEYYPKAKKIASEMGMKDNYAYIYGVLENMLGIEESTLPKEIADGFVKSNKKSLKEYLIDFYEEIVSSDFPDTPEGSPKKKKCDEEDDFDDEDDAELDVEENCGRNHKNKK